MTPAQRNFVKFFKENKPMRNSKQYLGKDLAKLKQYSELKFEEYLHKANLWTDKTASIENEKRMSLLRLDVLQERALRRKITSCSPEDRCGSLACAFCKTVNQIGLVEEMYTALSGIPLLHVTIINPRDFISGEKLATFEPQRLLNRLNKMVELLMKERKITGYACVEVVYRKDVNRFVPHIHMILKNCPKEVFDKHISSYRKQYKSYCSEMGINMRCVHSEHEKPSYERIRLLGYLCKFSTQAKAGWISKSGFRPNRPDHNAHMLFLDKTPLSSVFQGIGLRRSKLKADSVKISTGKANPAKKRPFSSIKPPIWPEKRLK
jgi:hypothetical protein